MSNLDFTFTIEGGENLTKAFEDIPYTVGWAARRAFGRIMQDVRRFAIDTQQDKGMRRLLRTSLFNVHTPKRGGFKSAKAIVKSKGLEGIEGRIIATSPILQLWEEGATVKRKGMLIPVGDRMRKIAKRLTKDSAAPALAGATLADEFINDSKKETVWIKTRHGKTLFQVIKGTRRKERKMVAIVTTLNEVKFPASLGIRDAFERAVNESEPHIEDMWTAIEAAWEKSRKSRQKQGAKFAGGLIGG